MEFLIAAESIGVCEVWKEESVVESLYGFPAVISVRTGPFELAPGFSLVASARFPFIPSILPSLSSVMSFVARQALSAVRISIRSSNSENLPFFSRF